MGHNGGCGQMCSDGNSGPQCSCWDGFTSDDYTGCDGMRTFKSQFYLKNNYFSSSLCPNVWKSQYIDYQFL